MPQALRIGVFVGGFVLLALGVVFVVGDFSVEGFIRRYASLSDEIAAQPVLSGIIGAALYTVLVVSFLPGVPFLSVPFGLVFGWFAGTLIVFTGTGLGVAALYAVTRYVLPERFGGAAGRALDSLADRLRDNLIGTMLFLRLMPPVPFTLLNVALPSLKVPFVPYLWTTLVGMAPRLFVYALVGESVRGIADRQIAACTDEVCAIDLSVADFMTGNIVIATALLGVIALVPMAWRWWSDRVRRETRQARSGPQE